MTTTPTPDRWEQACAQSLRRSQARRQMEPSPHPFPEGPRQWMLTGALVVLAVIGLVIALLLWVTM